jgi:hypothetical protein
MDNSPQYYDLLRKKSVGLGPNAAAPEDRWLEQARYKLAETMYNSGAFNDFRTAYQTAGKLSGLLDFVPVIGDVKAGVESRDAFSEGRYLEGGLLGGGAMLGMIPGVGDAAQQGIKKAAEMVSGYRKTDPLLTDIPTVDVNISTPAEAKGADRFISTGQYKGAPSGIDSPKKLESLRSNLYDLLQEGALGRNWYDQSSESGRFLTGDRPGYAQQYAIANAATSQGASVPSNQGFGVKAYNQIISGNTVDSGRFPSAVRGIAEQIPEGEVSLGPKIGPFYEANMLQPGGQAKRPTNDIWMARAFDYRKPDGSLWAEGLTDPQHRFMDTEINKMVEKANAEKLGGFSNWTPEKVQAAIWVAKKASDEKIPLTDAAYDFSHNLDKLTANINVESEPALGLMHLSELRQIPEAMSTLQEAQRKALSDESGRDLLSLSTGALTRPTDTGYGYYKNFSAPTDVIRVLAGTETGEKFLDPASRGLLEGVASAHGLLRGQESVGYNYLRKDVDATARNAAAVNIGRQFSPEEMLGIGAKLDDVFGGIAFAVNTPNGINILTSGQDDLIDWAKSQNIDIDDWIKYKNSNIEDLPKNVQKKKDRFNKAWQGKVNSIVKDAAGVKPEFGLNSGDLVGSFEQYTPSAYLEAIEKSGVEKIMEPVARDMASRLDQADLALMAQYPDVGQRSDLLVRVREAIAKEGFSGVRKLVEMGIVPVGLVAILYPEFADQQNSGQKKEPGLIGQL